MFLLWGSGEGEGVSFPGTLGTGFIHLFKLLRNFTKKITTYVGTIMLNRKALPLALKIVIGRLEI